MQTGWLSPQGTLIPCPAFGHIDAAREILETHGMDSVYSSQQLRFAPDEILYDNRWVHISSSAFGVREQLVTWKHFLTEAQKNFLVPYFTSNSLPVNALSKARWELEQSIA